MNYCYLLYIPGTNRTYIGATNDPAHRLRQHNGELAGGAKATSGKQWTQAFYVSGFPDWSNTLQFEWAWKRQSRNQPGLKGKILGLQKLLALSRATTTATPYTYWSTPFTLHATPQQRAALQKIDTANFLLETQHSPSMSSAPHTVESLTAQVADMATELSLVQKRLADALAKLEPKAASAKKATVTAAPKDPNAPAAQKKPLSGYMLFCDRTRKAAPTMTYTAAMLGELWKALSDAQKAEYKVTV
jgi:predicted GIY-YIG superfamily endonuclease